MSLRPAGEGEQSRIPTLEVVEEEPQPRVSSRCGSECGRPAVLLVVPGGQPAQGARAAHATFFWRTSQALSKGVRSKPPPNHQPARPPVPRGRSAVRWVVARADFLCSTTYSRCRDGRSRAGGARMVAGRVARARDIGEFTPPCSSNCRRRARAIRAAARGRFQRARRNGRAVRRSRHHDPWCSSTSQARTATRSVTATLGGSGMAEACAAPLSFFAGAGFAGASHCRLPAPSRISLRLAPRRRATSAAGAAAAFSCADPSTARAGAALDHPGILERHEAGRVLRTLGVALLLVTRAHSDPEDLDAVLRES